MSANIFEELNEAAKIKETIKLTTLNIGIPYHIYDMKITNTKYGRQIMAHVNDAWTFLPGRMNCLTDQQIEEINNKHIALIVTRHIGKTVEIVFAPCNCNKENM
ncbi:VP-ORF2 [Acheta domesticus segmented densovirus]|nr:VP-ORF2 [Acheta domesticus segmented densovirus]